jgi:hypothetical protein
MKEIASLGQCGSGKSVSLNFQNNDTLFNDTQHTNKKMKHPAQTTLSIQCNNAECRYAECRYAKCLSVVPRCLNDVTITHSTKEPDALLKHS